MIDLRTYPDAAAFLADAGAELERDEAANSLILGVCTRLAQHPEQLRQAPYLATVRDHDDLLLAAMMTPPHNLVVSAQGDAVEAAAQLLITDLLRGGWRAPGVLGPSAAARQMAVAWSAATGAGHTLKVRQWLYRLDRVQSPVPERGQLRQATESDVELVAAWWYAFHQEVFHAADREEAAAGARARIAEGRIYLWDDEGPASMAMENRPVRRGISVGLIYTPPERRGKGYATACVGELSRRLLASEWEFCTLFADVTNEPANRAYRQVGYRVIGEYREYIFEE